MVNLCSILKRLSSIPSIPCIIIPLPAMALSKWQFMSEDDPWKVSAFVSAVMELFLSILLLLGAAIAFFTSRIVKVFGLEPPCTYIGCSHSLHSHSKGNQERHTLGLNDRAVMEIGVDGNDAYFGRQADHQCSSTDRLLYKSRVRSRYQAFAHGRDLFQVTADFEEEGKDERTDMKVEDCQCSSSDSLLQQRRSARSERPRRRDFVHAQSIAKLKGAYPSLLSARSSSKSINAEKVFQVEQGRELEERDIKGEVFSVHDAALAHHSEADTLVDVANKVDALEGKECEETNVRDGDLCSQGTTLAHCSKVIKGHTVMEENANKVHASKSEKCEKEDTQDEDFSDHDTIVAQHSEAVKEHALVADATSKDKEHEERDHGTVLAHQSKAVEGRTLVEDSNKVDALTGKECEERDMRVEDFCDHGATGVEAFKGHTLVEDADKVHTSKGKQAHDAESSLEFLNKIGNIGDVCNTEHSNSGLLPCEENRCVIQFGSIIATTCITDGTTRNVYVNSGRIENMGLVNVARNGGGILHETGRNQSSKDIDKLQSYSYMFGDVIANKNSLEESTLTYDMSTCTIEGSSAGLLEGKFTPIKEKPPSKLPLDDDYDEDEEEDAEEEGLDALKLALQAERSMLAALEAELENERNAAAVATSEAMAMISRLQEEKSAMQMEVAQLQRTSVERADYDEEALAVLTEILIKRETENMALEKEVELYREKLLAGNGTEPNGGWFKETRRNLALQPHSKPLLLTGQDGEFRSPLGLAAQQQSLTSLGYYCRSKCGNMSEGLGDVEGGCGVFVPIHDVYEVHSASNRSPPCEEERDPLEGFNGASRSNELQARMSRQITDSSPRTQTIVSEEIPSTPTSMVQTGGWDIEKSLHPDDFYERHDLRSYSFVSREERRMELEEIQQLAVRLKALEEDRDLLRETLESFKRRDAELNLLQDISQHLRVLRMANPMEVSGGALSEETSVTSPSRSRPLKKRRYQTLMQHQKSV